MISTARMPRLGSLLRLRLTKPWKTRADGGCIEFTRAASAQGHLDVSDMKRVRVQAMTNRIADRVQLAH